MLALDAWPAPLPYDSRQTQTPTYVGLLGFGGHLRSRLAYASRLTLLSSLH